MDRKSFCPHNLGHFTSILWPFQLSNLLLIGQSQSWAQCQQSPRRIICQNLILILILTVTETLLSCCVVAILNIVSRPLQQNMTFNSNIFVYTQFVTYFCSQQVVLWLKNADTEIQIRSVSFWKGCVVAQWVKLQLRHRIESCIVNSHSEGGGRVNCAIYYEQISEQRRRNLIIRIHYLL